MVLANAEVEGVPCGGYLIVGPEDEEQWHIFPDGIGQLQPTEHLGQDLDSFAQVARLATTLGLPFPLKPSAEIARELLREGVPPPRYAALAQSIDSEFEIEEPQ